MINLDVALCQKIAQYTAKNTSDWIVYDERLNPKAQGETGKSGLAQIYAGNIILEQDQEQEITKGKMFSYVPHYIENGKITKQKGKTQSVPGLTSVEATDLLYGCMAPNQFIVGKKIKMPKLMGKIVDSVKIFFPTNVSKDEINKIKAEITKISFNSLEDLVTQIYKCFGPMMGKMNQDNKYKLKDVLDDFLLQSVIPIIGQKYIENVANSVSDQKKYAALTIAGKEQSESSGFGKFHQKIKFRSKNKTEQDNPTVAWYKGGKKDPISHHFVIQSRDSINKKGEKIDGMLNIGGLDFKQIVKFYNQTMAKGIPVVVNCTDGIDRTGILMVALMMLHSYDQALKEGKDITQLPEAEQQALVLKIVEGLKKDRGPYFLRKTLDVQNAVMLGFNLIGHKKKMDLNLKKSQGVLPKLERAFFQINNHKNDNENNKQYRSKLPETVADVVTSTKKLYNIDTAPLNVFTNAIKNGFDPNYKLKDNKSLIEFMVGAYNREPTFKNFQEFITLLIHGKEPVLKALETASINNKDLNFLVGCMKNAVHSNYDIHLNDDEIIKTIHSQDIVSLTALVNKLNNIKSEDEQVNNICYHITNRINEIIPKKIATDKEAKEQYLQILLKDFASKYFGKETDSKKRQEYFLTQHYSTPKVSTWPLSLKKVREELKAAGKSGKSQIRADQAENIEIVLKPKYYGAKPSEKLPSIFTVINDVVKNISQEGNFFDSQMEKVCNQMLNELEDIAKKAQIDLPDMRADVDVKHKKTIK
ncbi:MAG: dual specificity protein phosphatase family protein [Proteobacteria bacterium]|nr:dual specificity protein phosphatase family protein [Pseudomonadota bacterium]